MPDPPLVAHQNGRRYQPVFGSAHGLEVFACLLHRFGLVEPASLAFKHRIGTQHQNARMACADASCLEFGKGLGSLFHAGTFCTQGLLHGIFVDAGCFDIKHHAGVFQHGPAARAGRSQNERGWISRHQGNAPKRS